MRTLLVPFFVLLAVCPVACGGSVSDPPGPSGGPDGGGTVTYTKVADPDDLLSVGLAYDRDASMLVTAVYGTPSITRGNVPGQSWFVFAGPCPTVVDAQGKIVQMTTAVYPLWLAALRNGTAVSIAQPPTAAALGMYVGAQLPIATCFEFVNCDDKGLGVCSFEGFAIGFN